MLAKCANAGCSHVFRYFGKGKLYRVAVPKQKGRYEKMYAEHFWLCPDCAPVMAIVVEPDGKPVVIPRSFMQVYRETRGKLSLANEVSCAVLMNGQGVQEQRV